MTTAGRGAVLPAPPNDPPVRRGRVLLWLLLAVTCLGTAGLAWPQSASAQVAVRVTPTRLTPTIAVGDETYETVTLENLSGDAMRIEVRPQQPAAGGSPSVFFDPDTFPLEPGKTVAVKAHIVVPASVTPGDYKLGASLTAHPGASSELSIAGRVDVAIDVAVIQPLTDAEWSAPGLVDGSDEVVFWMHGRNAGSFPARLDAQVAIHGLIYGETDVDAQSQEMPVGSAGEVSAVWQDTPVIGIKRATLSLTAGAGEPQQKQIILVFFPWKLSLGLLGVVLTCGAGMLIPLPRR